MTWAVTQDPTALAPFGVLLASSHTSSEFMYDSLLEWDSKTNIRPALAESYVVKDPKTIDWTLRKGVMFHNGKELTAADALYSIQKQQNPPPPGSTGVLSFFPAIDSAQVLSKYVLRLKLTKPDASVFGWFAWGRWSPIVPEGIYDQINVTTQGIGTGPFKLVSYQPNDHLDYAAWPQFWKKGLPYYDQLTIKIIPDEQATIAALQAGAIDGAATISADSARGLVGNPNLTVLKGLTAGFFDLQFTIKAGENKPWSDVRVRQAVNLAVNRVDLANKVFGGQTQYSGHVPPKYGPWPLSQDDLSTKYEKFDLPTAKSLMSAAGQGSGFTVSLIIPPLTTFTQIAELLQSYMKQINVTVNIQTVDSPTFSKDYGTGAFDWLLNQRGIRGDVHGFVSEFNPGTSPNYNLWFNGYKNIPMWRLVGNGQITLDQAKRLPMYTKLQQILMTELLEVPLLVAYKYQVVNKRLKNMYVSYTDFNPGLRTAYLTS